MRTSARLTPGANRLQGGRNPYLFVSPFFVLFAIFFLVPTLASLVLALYRWNGVATPEWVGLSNFRRLFSDPVFWQVARNTTFYTLASVLILIPLGLVLALGLNARALRFKRMWRSIYFTPVVVSAAATSLVFQILLSRDAGLVNGLLGQFGLGPVPWLQSRAWVKVGVFMVVAWRTLPLLTVYFLAGLQAIPKELHEAAMTDGAGSVRRFWYVTLPLLRPVVLFVLVVVTLNSIQLFDEVQILTDGGPANASATAMHYLYSRGFERLRFGFASSVATLLFGIALSAALVEARTLGGLGIDREG